MLSPLDPSICVLWAAIVRLATDSSRYLVSRVLILTMVLLEMKVYRRILPHQLTLASSAPNITSALKAKVSGTNTLVQMVLSAHLVQPTLFPALLASSAKTKITKSFRGFAREVSTVLWELEYQSSVVRQMCAQKVLPPLLLVVKPQKIAYQVSIFSSISARSASQVLSVTSGPTKSTRF